VVVEVVCGRGRLVRTQTIQESLCLFSFLFDSHTDKKGVSHMHGSRVLNCGVIWDGWDG